MNNLTLGPAPQNETLENRINQIVGQVASIESILFGNPPKNVGLEPTVSETPIKNYIRQLNTLGETLNRISIELENLK